MLTAAAVSCMFGSCKSSSGRTCITRLSVLNMKPPAVMASAFVCVCVGCDKRSIRVLIINSFCCYGSAFPKASSVRGKLRHYCHITPSCPCPTHTHTHTQIHSRPNSRWHNTAVSQNNSTQQLNMKEPWRSCPSVLRAQTGPGSMCSAVTVHTAATCSSKLFLTPSIQVSSMFHQRLKMR